MAHLGSDVAAFVDGQLSSVAMRDAEAHLQICEICAHAVRQQRLLKSRMGTVSAPGVSADLMASLAALAAEPPDDRWWTRMRRGAPFRVGVVLAGTSLGVAALAYAVGGSAAGGIGDRIAPPFEEYSAGFFGATATPAATMVSDDMVDELARDGWPCHQQLAGDLERTTASLTRDDNAIALTYTNGSTRLKLFEQSGQLDRASVDGFAEHSWDGATVWVHHAQPTVVTWDEDGVVYTMVTDADLSRIRAAVAQLPTRDGSRHPATRVGDGLSRMTGWVSAA